MKKKLFLLLFSFAAAIQFMTAQSKSEKYKNDFLTSEYTSKTEEKQKYINIDFSKLWTTTPNNHVLGFIGTNYQRFYIKFLTVKKDPANPDTYLVTGKNKVKTNICSFTGTIKILSIRRNTEMDEVLDDTMKNYCILASYSFKENPKELHVGAFEGIAQCNFYLDKKNNIRYYHMEDNEEFSNNGFVGTWKSYDGKYNKPCNWGDFRIPESGDLDDGAAYFYPSDAYEKNGWQNYIESMLDYGTAANKARQQKAEQIEKMQWWK
jgi:hypothetical protein